MKNNKGITLIALVVTIIVLLILAGVSIAMLTGDNGILGRAKEASTQTAVTNARDEISMKVSECVTEYFAVHYAGANNSTYNTTTYTGANAIDQYILAELKKLNLKDVNVKVGTSDLASATAPNDSTGADLIITSTNDSSVFVKTKWSVGGKLSQWDNSHLTK